MGFFADDGGTGTGCWDSRVCLWDGPFVALLFGLGFVWFFFGDERTGLYIDCYDCFYHYSYHRLGLLYRLLSCFVVFKKRTLNATSRGCHINLHLHEWFPLGPLQLPSQPPMKNGDSQMSAVSSCLSCSNAVMRFSVVFEASLVSLCHCIINSPGKASCVPGLWRRPLGRKVKPWSLLCPALASTGLQVVAALSRIWMGVGT